MAAWHGTREVGFAVIATTAVLVMVFVPIAFMEGMVGRLFTEFAILLSLAVLFSSLVALTLTPAMGSWLMRAVDKPNAPDRHAGQRPRLGGAAAIAPLLGPCCATPSGCPWCCCSASAASAPSLASCPRASLPQRTGRALCVREGSRGHQHRADEAQHAAGGGRRPAAARPGRGAGGEFQHPAFGRGGDQTGMAIIQLSDWAVREQTATEFGRSRAGCSPTFRT